VSHWKVTVFECVSLESYGRRQKSTGADTDGELVNHKELSADDGDVWTSKVLISGMSMLHKILRRVRKK